MLAGNLVYKLVTDASGLDQGLRNADRRADDAGRRTGRTFGNSVNQGLNSTRVDTSFITRAMSQVETAMRSSTSRLGSLMTGIFQGIGITIATTLTNAISSAVSAGINKLKELSAFVYQVGSDFRNLQIAFRTIVGDRAQADRLIADLRKFAAVTPLTSTEVTQAAQKLLTVTRPEDMVKTLQRLGDVAAGTKSKIGEVATVYAQVLTKGQVYQEELLQFAERGIPIHVALAKVLKVEKEELADLGKKGLITSDALVKAFAAMADEGGKFNGIMQQQSATAAGMGSTLQDRFEMMAVAVYDKVEPALQQILKSMNEVVSKAGEQSNMLTIIEQASQRVSNWFKTHQELLNQAALAAGRFAEQGMQQLVEEASKLADYLDKNPEALREAWAGAKDFLVVMKDLAKVTLELLGALAQIGKELYSIIKPLDEFMRTIPTMDETIAKHRANGGKTTSDHLKETWNVLTGDGSQLGVNVSSPLAGKSFKQLIDYKPSHGQGFYGQRDRGTRQHSKVDFDSRIGGGQGAVVLAVSDGNARMRDLGTGNSVGIDIYSKDAQGRSLQYVYNHLAKAEATKLFGGKSEIPVRAGQRLSTVTMDSLSTGAHLDFGVKINGKYVDPQKFMANYLLPMQKGSSNTSAIGANAGLGQYGPPSPETRKSGGYYWGKAANYAPSDLSGLTTRGRQAMEALKNPNVRAYLDAVAIAELGDGAAAKGGYGYLFGDVNGKETFDPNKLGSHPKKRISANGHTSSATGRYQTMDFVWNEEAGRLGIRDFKPQSQEIMAVSRMMYRGILNDVMKGNFASTIKRSGYMDASSEWASLQGNPYGQGTSGGKTSTFLGNIQRGLQNIRPTNSESPARNRTTTNGSSDIRSLADQEQSAGLQAAQIQAAKKKEAAEKVKKEQERLTQERQERERAIAQYMREANNTDMDVLRAQLAATNDRGLQFQIELKQIETDRQTKLTDIEADAKAGAPGAAINKRRTNANNEADLRIQALKNKINEELKREQEQRTSEERDRNLQIAESIRAAKESDLAVLRAEVTATGDRKKQFHLELREIDSEYDRVIEQIKQDAAISPASATKRRANAFKEMNFKKQAARNSYAEYLKQQSEQSQQERWDKQDTAFSNNQRVAESRLSAQRSGASTLDELLQVDIETARQQLTGLLNEIERLGRSGKLSADQMQELRRNYTSAFEAQVENLNAAYEQQKAEAQQQRAAEAQAKGEAIRSAIAANRERQYAEQDGIYGRARTLFSSDMELSQARSALIRNPEKLRKANIETATQQIGLDLGDRLQEIEQMGRSGKYTAEQLQKLTDNAHALAQVKLDGLSQQFMSVGDTIKQNVGQAFGTLLNDLVMGTQSVGDAFNNMLNTVLSSLANMAIQQLVGGMFGFSQGGTVQAYASGGFAGRGKEFSSIGDAMRYERSASGRRPILAVLHEGEGIIPAKDMQGIGSIQAFASGNLAFAGSPSSSSPQFNFGDFNIGGGMDIDPRKLREAIKTVVYEIVVKESGQGGIIRR